MALALEFYRSAPKYLGARALGKRAGPGDGRPGAAAPRDPEGSGAVPRRLGARGRASGSAGATSRRSRGARPSTSRRWCRCRSCPVTRSSGSSSTTATTSWPGNGRAPSVLGCAARGEVPPCEHCARRMSGVRSRDGRPPEAGAPDGLLHRDRRRLEPDAAAPSVAAVAGPRRDERSDAVLVEPLACAIHVFRARIRPAGRCTSSAPARSGSR